jgi:hypothetical protein
MAVPKWKFVTMTAYIKKSERSKPDNLMILLKFFDKTGTSYTQNHWVEN